MIKNLGSLLFILIITTGQIPSAHAQANEDKLLIILREELLREMKVLAETKDPVYYMDYRVDVENTYTINTSFGSLIQSNNNESRVLTSSVKVGSYELDNTHGIVQGGGGGHYGYAGGVALPLEDEPLAIKQKLWNITQGAYNSAKTQYRAVLNQERHNQDEGKKSNDFSKEKAEQHYEPLINNKISKQEIKEWENKIKQYSAAFLKNSNIQSADVSMGVNFQRKYFVSSEETEIVQNLNFSFLSINASALTLDGDIVPLYRTYFAFDRKDIPSSNQIQKDIDRMIEQLEKLRLAPLAEPFTGPAVLSERSAAVFFHEIFGHRVEGHRLKQENDGQTFREKIENKVLPKSMNVIFDPSLTNLSGTDLIGTYKYDDQGVKGSKVDVVKGGVLKSFLMSRTPLDDFENSNGHGRASSGRQAVARQSNLVIESTDIHSNADLRKMLLKECKKQDKLYGYFFKDVTGGFTYTDRNTPNVFNIMPTEVYRIYVDGKPDELVRGVNLIGTPLAMFAEIKATGDTKGVFTGFCGAESGTVPVSATSPSLFVRRIETQKKPVIKQEPPLLSKPISEMDKK